MSKYEFDCGCKINLLNEEVKSYDQLPVLEIPYDEMTEDLNYQPGCPEVWDLLGRGKAKGVFQLESNLGQGWAKKVEPNSLEEMSALISLIRPGCISGDTKIIVRLYSHDKKKYNVTDLTISQLHKQFHNNHNKYQADIISLDEKNNTFVKNKILDVMFNGVKSVYRPNIRTLEKCRNGRTNYKLECTNDHKLLVYKKGWIELQDIEVGDRIAVRNYSTNKQPKKHVSGKSHLYTEGLIDKTEILREREKYKIPVSDDVLWGMYEGKEYVGEKEVYDISVEGPNHNFIAGNVVVHNCLKAIMDGKSMTMHYVDRKHKRDKVSYLNSELEQFLAPTYGVLCVEENTFVSMESGVETKIRDVSPNDKIVSINQNTLKVEKDTCNNILVSPKTNGVELILENGYRAILTNDHKVLTQRGEVKVRDLNCKTDVVQIISNNTNKIETNISLPVYKNEPRWGYLVGQLLGDGCSAKCISSGIKENHDKLYKYLKDSYPELFFTEYFHCRSWYISISGKERDGRKTKYRKFVEHLGLHHTKNDKIVSDILFKSCNEIKLSFLAGLFDADGHSSVDDNGYAIRHYCTSNWQVINAIRAILSYYNIDTYIDNNGTHLYINNTKEFDNLIKKYVIIKRVNIGRPKTGARTGSYPKNDFLEYAQQNFSQTSQRQLSKNKKISRSIFRKNKAFVNIETAKKLGITFGDVCMMKIKKITPIKGKLKFYSISVEKNHNFVGNGIILSNCYQEQTLRIVQVLAGFTETEADLLRRGLGKKKADVVAKIRQQFMEGCEKVGRISQEDAKEIYDWIEKGNRYLFNKCVSGDTIIRRANIRKNFVGFSVEEMYKIRNDISYAKKVGKLSTYKQWKLWGNYGGALSMCDDGRLRRNIVKDIRYMGPKPVYRITLEDGTYIDVTSNHKFPTPNGEKLCNELAVGNKLYKCGVKEKIETHHIDGNRSNSDHNNLQNLCSSCHKKTEYKNGRTKRGEKGYPSYTQKIVLIEKIGTKNVYDVEMEGPNHNFVTGQKIVTCNSHGISYGSVGYLTAWVKTHFPLHFYCSWIKFARGKSKSQQEVKELVKDARSLGVDVYTPTVDSLFSNESDVCINIDNVTFGIRSVKSMGDAAVKKFIEQIQQAEEECGKTLSEMTWVEFMMYVAPIVKKTSIINLISVGMFDYFNVPRQRMLYEYDACYGKNGLTKLEAKRIRQLPNEFERTSDALRLFCSIDDRKRGPSNKNRIEKIGEIVNSLENPPFDIDHDDPKWIMTQEMDLLGTSLTFSAVDTVDTPPVANTTCREFEDGKNTDHMILSVEVTSARPYMCKNKKEMGFVSLEDNTGIIDGVVFTDEWEKYSHLFYEGSIIACVGKRSDRGGLLIQKVFEI